MEAFKKHRDLAALIAKHFYYNNSDGDRVEFGEETQSHVANWIEVGLRRLETSIYDDVTLVFDQIVTYSEQSDDDDGEKLRVILENIKGLRQLVLNFNPGVRNGDDLRKAMADIETDKGGGVEALLKSLMFARKVEDE